MEEEVVFGLHGRVYKLVLKFTPSEAVDMNVVLEMEPPNIVAEKFVCGERETTGFV